MQTFVFLQGLPGPSLRMIADALAQRGHRIVRIQGNGGDWWDWRGGGIAWRGPVSGFDPWFEALCRREGVGGLVLFGETRPLHRAALAVAERLGIDAHVLEEGYLRPDSITLEYWPAGRRWKAPRSLADCRALAPAAPREWRPVTNHFARRLRESVAYWLAATLLFPLWPRYRSHRLRSPWYEAAGWIARRWRRGRERAASAASLARVEGRRFFLFPLQLDGDAQILHRSPFADMAAAVEQLLADFAANAPPGCALVIKRHPLDPDPLPWRGLVEQLAAALGIERRIAYIEYGDLDDLIARCAGVVTVNSTVGSLALAAGRPVKVLGEAIYGLDGLVATCPLATFWHSPPMPRPGAFDLFSAALRAECLVNAGFHSEDGLMRLARAAADRIAPEGSG